MPGPIHRKRERAARRRRFTLLELAVVVVLIAVLAVIAVPTFLSQRADAQDAEAMGDVRAAASIAEGWYALHRTYAGAGAVVRRETPGVGFGYLMSAPARGYLVSTTSASGRNATFSVERGASGVRTYYCGAAGAGGCPDDHDWNHADPAVSRRTAQALPPVVGRYLAETR